MKLMENWKRFWTLNRHHAAGFTLVELIVVIAILAILAGVAVPAYSGYIAQANKAADEQLLDALNTAFASACAINGENHYNRTDNPVITVTDGVVGKDALTTGNEKIDKSFEAYFEGGTFKVFTYLAYSKDKGCFEGKELPAAYANLLNTLMSDPNFDSNKAALLASTFMTADGLGAEALLEQVGQLSGVADVILSTVTDISSSGFASMVWNEEFMNDLAVKAGYSDWEAWGSALEEQGYSEDAINTILANGAVLSAANNTASLDTSYLTAGGLKNRIQTNMDNAETAQAAFAEASLAYGMYMTYAYSTGNQDMIDKANNVSDTNGLYAILEEMESEAFKTYLGSDQGKNDLAGYQAAMGIINSTSENKEAVENALLNGFDDPALIAIIQQAMSGN